MPQSLTINLIHLVYSTHERRPWLDAEIQSRIWAYQASLLNGHDCPVFHVGGVADHVHILFSLSKNMKLVDAVREVKANSSSWIKKQGAGYNDFAWQRGYGAFSVSPSNKARVGAYIENQARHHERVTFQDEFRALLRKHGIEWDERYVWD
jgi:putative transposase